MSVMVPQGEAKTRPIAGTIGLVFGGLWSLLGAQGLPYGQQLPAEGLGLLVTVALIAVLWSRRVPDGSSGGLFRRKSYIIAVVLEVVAIYVASFLLARNGLKSYFIPALGVIVGLHFIGLWQVTRLPRFLWIAGWMCGVSTIAACLPSVLEGFEPRSIVAGFGNALVLWIGAGRSLRTS